MSNLQIKSYQHLCELIDQWNDNRLDLFSLSKPNQNLEFNGVMRFYFQEPGEKITTKCIRVSSSATTRAVITALIEKFHPDMKMLTLPAFSIWEVHENEQERKLDLDERPLIAQLSWHKDDLEGRFLLKSDDFVQTNSKSSTKFLNENMNSLHRSQKRFSKRENKESRKKYQSKYDDDNRSIYAELPQNTFTRTISNPEIVMQKRREKKLENKLKEIVNGGSLKIYGVELFPNRPYVTLLLNVNDSAAKIVAKALDKYGIEPENFPEYALVEVTLSQDKSKLSRSLSDLKNADSNVDRYIADEEFPLLNYLNNSDSDNIVYLLRKRPSIFLPFDAASNLQHVDSRCSGNTLNNVAEKTKFNTQPYLAFINSDGSENVDQKVVIPEGVIEMGSQAAVQVRSANILPRHCAIYYVNEKVYVEPLSSDALVEVNGNNISASVELMDNSFLCLGKSLLFRLNFPQFLLNHKKQNSCNSMELETNRYGVNSALQQSQHIESYNNHVHEHYKQPLQRSLSKNSENIYSNAFSNSDLVINEIPALIDLPNQLCEEKLLRFEFFETPVSRFGFRLTPAFTLYMACRYRFSQFVVPPLPMEKRLHSLYNFISMFCDLCFECIHVNSSNYNVLAFWLANTSEFLHMIQTDIDLRQCEQFGIVNRLMDLVEKAYDLFVECCCITVRTSLHVFLNTSLDDDFASQNLLNLLEDIIRLIRKSLLNSALTIQIFSQLFHFINMYTFNWLVTTKEGKSYITHSFGIRLKERLHLLNAWANKQGLEQACECHMDCIQQTVDLLITPKTNDQIASLGATCYKLNSIQVRYLLENYSPDLCTEKPIHIDLIEHVVYLAKGQADAMANQDGVNVQLEEAQKLQLPFLFPQDAYLVELLRGIPPLLMSFSVSIKEKGIGRLILQNTTLWTYHMEVSNGSDFNFENKSIKKNNSSSNFLSNPLPLSRMFYDYETPPVPACVNLTNNRNMPASFSMGNIPDSRIENETLQTALSVIPNRRASTSSFAFLSHSDQNAMFTTKSLELITIYRNANEGIGLSIVAGQGFGEQSIGIYVKKVIDGSAAFKNGGLSMGDQLISVNGRSLVGISQEKAAQKISAAGTEIRFEVAKDAAKLNGLDSWLSGNLNNDRITQQNILNNDNSFKIMPNLSLAHQVGNFSNQIGSVSANNNQHNRSISASELYSQTDTVSLMSENSNNVPYGSKSHYNVHQQSQHGTYTQQPNIHHQQQGSNSKLPSHYKTGHRTNVIQPERTSSPVNVERVVDNASGPASPTSLLNQSCGEDGYSVLTRLSMPSFNSDNVCDVNLKTKNKPAKRTLMGDHLFNQQQMHYCFNPQQNLSSGVSDYSHLPLINNNYNLIAPPSYSENFSLNSSTFSTNLNDTLQDFSTHSTNFAALPYYSRSSNQNSQNPNSIDLKNYFSCVPTLSAPNNNIGSHVNALKNTNVQQPNNDFQNLSSTQFSKLNQMGGMKGMVRNSLPSLQLQANTISSSSTSPLPAPPPSLSMQNQYAPLTLGSNNINPSILHSNINGESFSPKLISNKQYLTSNLSTPPLLQMQSDKLIIPEQMSKQQNFNSPTNLNRFAPKPQFAQHQTKIPLTKEINFSGRRSAPLFGAEESIGNYENIENKALITDELSEELNRLDSKNITTEAEHLRYQKLLRKLAGQQPNNMTNLDSSNRHALRQAHSASVLGFENPSMMAKQYNRSNNLPFISEMESRFDLRNCLKKSNRTNSQSAIESMIDDVTEVASRLNNITVDSADMIRASNLGHSSSRLSNSSCSSTNSGVKSSLREFSASPEDRGKKRVQFREDADDSQQSGGNSNRITLAKKLDSINELTEEFAANYLLIENRNLNALGDDNSGIDNAHNENEEPRTQIIGANEIYIDPRQRRLNEFQAKLLKPVVDGSNLGFRDKMKLFAEQLGEQVPKNKHKISSAQRDIETFDGGK